MALEQYSQFLT